MAVTRGVVEDVLGWLLIPLALCTFVCGLMTSVSIGWIRRILDGGCPLDGSVRLSRHGNWTSVVLDPVVDADTAVGGVACSYCVYVNVAVIIYAVVWLWFYVFLCRRDCATRSRTGPNVRLLPVALCFTLVLWVCTTVSLGFVNAGTKTWCSNVETSLGKPCNYLAKVEWLSIPDGHLIYHYSQIALVSSWLLFVTLSVNTVVMVVVLVLDVLHSPSVQKTDLPSVDL